MTGACPARPGSRLGSRHARGDDAAHDRDRIIVLRRRSRQRTTSGRGADATPRDVPQLERMDGRPGGLEPHSTGPVAAGDGDPAGSSPQGTWRHPSAPAGSRSRRCAGPGFAPHFLEGRSGTRTGSFRYVEAAVVEDRDGDVEAARRILPGPRLPPDGCCQAGAIRRATADRPVFTRLRGHP